MKIGRLNLPLSPRDWLSAWRSDYADFSWWRRWLLRVAVLSLVAGIGLRTAVGGWSDSLGGAEEPTSAEARKALVDGARPLVRPPADDAEESPLWSGVSGYLMKCGASFLLAFFVAYLIRKAIKIGLMLLLGFVGVLLLLDGFDVIDLPYEAWSQDLKTLAGTLGGKGREIMEVVKNWLPSSLSSGAGLFAGFRRS